LKQAVRTSVPSGLKDAAMTLWPWRNGELNGLPVAASQTRANPSKLLVTT
jgi:hypothetical protein